MFNTYTVSNITTYRCVVLLGMNDDEVAICVGEDLRFMSSKSVCCVWRASLVQFKYVGEVLV